MKKLVLTMAAVVALGMVSCGQSDKEKAEDSAAAQAQMDSIESSDIKDEAVINEGAEIEMVTVEDGKEVAEEKVPITVEEAKAAGADFKAKLKEQQEGEQ